MEFIFLLTEYNDVLFKLQVSKALEKRTELVSRKKHPQIWRCTDKINLREKASEEVLKKRRSRYKIYGIFLLLLGFFLFIPSLMDIKNLIIPLIVSIFTIAIGIVYLSYGRKLKKVKLNAFDKAAIKLFSDYEKIPAYQVIFTDEKIRLQENYTIAYGEIENFFITDDLFILIWKERITVLQKKDLISYNVEEFINFIIYKSHNLFEVVNIV
jgi:hypothetical protein